MCQVCFFNRRQRGSIHALSFDAADTAAFSISGHIMAAPIQGIAYLRPASQLSVSARKFPDGFIIGWA